MDKQIISSIKKAAKKLKKCLDAKHSDYVKEYANYRDEQWVSYYKACLTLFVEAGEIWVREVYQRMHVIVNEGIAKGEDSEEKHKKLSLKDMNMIEQIKTDILRFAEEYGKDYNFDIPKIAPNQKINVLKARPGSLHNRARELLRDIDKLLN
jgi:hypothetical protein